MKQYCEFWQKRYLISIAAKFEYIFPIKGILKEGFINILANFCIYTIFIATS